MSNKLQIMISISSLLTIALSYTTTHHHYNNVNTDSIPIYHASSHHLLTAADFNIIEEKLYSPNPITELIAGTWDDIHIVFTTGCNGYQNWQSEVLLYSWARLKHPGRITRIIAGCNNEKEKALANTTAIPNDDNRILFYFVPDFTPDQEEGGHAFYYFNKPNGMNAWIHDQFDSIYESVIVLLDPDMIILRPFLFHIESEAKKFAQWQHEKTTDNFNNEPRDMYVREGHPLSQKYGIGAKWLKWNGFCDERESCHPKDSVGWSHYSVGPPYIMHKNDWLKVCPKWVEYSPLALKYEPQPSILAEMYSYVIACAYYDLQHQYLFSMISDPDAGRHSENVDNMNWSFLKGQRDNSYHEFHILHYCQGFWLGKTRNHGTIRNGGWNWHKGHVPQDIMYNCEIPLLVQLDESDKEMIQMYKNRDRTKDNVNYWVLYHLNKYVNEAVLNYRLKYCKKEENEKNLKYKLVLQQPEADTITHRRMNYVLGDYESKKSWRGH